MLEEREENLRARELLKQMKLKELNDKHYQMMKKK